ncbi:hypothetical protein VOLCADRAFT_103992 [Volvox carteri f. nagariensis]|uniref:Uncharacterized protein n=1 Tax=Volvox carteri f. nagariensis TaxID=3068 RepID=D8TQI8_VOLCA|nr:uncharacterized protein VOLCADRAFT_103992 [Volvox carteri f. nagariensis]EFJ50041.1 hypothetical protein VOLCADRAFT_103992 [Volvox carteri f. nagariensis]|eukprot:XP_002948661.1 hypothetical protein VOLCADRAFT_103992 [Volvox carteri f. nagariensis]
MELAVIRTDRYQFCSQTGGTEAPSADDAAAWTLIPGAMRPAYQCTDDDAGRWLRVTVLPLTSSSGGRVSGGPTVLESRGSGTGQASNRPTLRAMAGPIVGQRSMPGAEQTLQKEPLQESRLVVVEGQYTAVADGANRLMLHLNPNNRSTEDIPQQPPQGEQQLQLPAGSQHSFGSPRGYRPRPQQTQPSSALSDHPSAEAIRSQAPSSSSHPYAGPPSERHSEPRGPTDSQMRPFTLTEPHQAILTTYRGVTSPTRIELPTHDHKQTKPRISGPGDQPRAPAPPPAPPERGLHSDLNGTAGRQLPPIAPPADAKNLDRGISRLSNMGPEAPRIPQPAASPREPTSPSKKGPQGQQQLSSPSSRPASRLQDFIAGNYALSEIQQWTMGASSSQQPSQSPQGASGPIAAPSPGVSRPPDDEFQLLLKLAEAASGSRSCRVPSPVPPQRLESAFQSTQTQPDEGSGRSGVSMPDDVGLSSLRSRLSAWQSQRAPLNSTVAASGVAPAGAGIANGSGSLREALEQLLAQHQETVQQVSFEAAMSQLPPQFSAPAAALLNGGPFEMRAYHSDATSLPSYPRERQPAPQLLRPPPSQAHVRFIPDTQQPGPLASRGSGTSSVSLSHAFGEELGGGDSKEEQPGRMSGRQTVSTLGSSRYQPSDVTGDQRSSPRTARGELEGEYLAQLLQHAQFETEAEVLGVGPQSGSSTSRAGPDAAAVLARLVEQEQATQGPSSRGSARPDAVGLAGGGKPSVAVDDWAHQPVPSSRAAAAGAGDGDTIRRGGGVGDVAAGRAAIRNINVGVADASRDSDCGCAGNHAGNTPPSPTQVLLQAAPASSSLRDMRHMNEALLRQLAESTRLQMQMQKALDAAMEQLIAFHAKEQQQRREMNSCQGSPGRQPKSQLAVLQGPTSPRSASPPRQASPLPHRDEHKNARRAASPAPGGAVQYYTDMSRRMGVTSRSKGRTAEAARPSASAFAENGGVAAGDRDGPLANGAGGAGAVIGTGVPTGDDASTAAALRALLHQHHLRWRAKKAKLKEQAQAWQYTAWRYATAWKKARAMLQAMVAAQEGAAAGAGSVMHDDLPSHQHNGPLPQQGSPVPRDFRPLAAEPVAHPPAGVSGRQVEHGHGGVRKLSEPAVLAGIAAALQRRDPSPAVAAGQRPSAYPAHCRVGMAGATALTGKADDLAPSIRGPGGKAINAMRDAARMSPPRLRPRPHRKCAPAAGGDGLQEDQDDMLRAPDKYCGDKVIGIDSCVKHPTLDSVAGGPPPGPTMWSDVGVDSGRDQASRGHRTARRPDGGEATAPPERVEVAAHWPATLRADGRSRSTSPITRPPWRDAGCTSPTGIRINRSGLPRDMTGQLETTWSSLFPPEPTQRPLQPPQPPAVPYRDPDGWWHYPEGWLDIHQPRVPHMLVQNAHVRPQRHHHRYADSQGNPAPGG